MSTPSPASKAAQEAPLSPTQLDAADTLAAETDAGPASESREARIREAAYRRFEARAGGPGSAVQDWIDAEAEIDAADAR